VAYLLPFIEASKPATKEGMEKSLATVKGMSMILGKIVAVLACNNYEIVDLGVMVTQSEL
jgi:5-methyltetrahydrofolate--homocysteine methyltransferase